MEQAAARAEAERHIQEHSLGEAAWIGRLSRIREFVLGAQDVWGKEIRFGRVRM